MISFRQFIAEKHIPLDPLPEPSEKQKEAGNYEKHHLKIHGLNLSIENPKGTERFGKDANGKKWSVTMKHHYGYILGYKGADKDHIDVFVGPEPESKQVFIVNQTKGNGQFDEHKIMMGFKDKDSALQGYLSNYEKGWNRVHSVAYKHVEDFKQWLTNGNLKKMA